MKHKVEYWITSVNPRTCLVEHRLYPDIKTARLVARAMRGYEFSLWKRQVIAKSHAWRLAERRRASEEKRETKEWME